MGLKPQCRPCFSLVQLKFRPCLKCIKLFIVIYITVHKAFLRGISKSAISVILWKERLRVKLEWMVKHTGGSRGGGH